jgi:hypothetical protein
MYRKLKAPMALLRLLCIISFISSMSVSVSFAETYMWEDLAVPFKQTFRFSATEFAEVHVTIPSDMLTASSRIPIFMRLVDYNPSRNPYMIVNGNRKAFYYLGGNGIVNILSKHLRTGENELLFSEQSTTGDTIFIYEMRHLQP